jgi:hypothetical protein
MYQPESRRWRHRPPTIEIASNGCADNGATKLCNARPRSGARCLSSGSRASGFGICARFGGTERGCCRGAWLFAGYLKMVLASGHGWLWASIHDAPAHQSRSAVHSRQAEQFEAVAVSSDDPLERLRLIRPARPTDAASHLASPLRWYGNSADRSSGWDRAQHIGMCHLLWAWHYGPTADELRY